VGNSGALLFDSFGEEIDAHDMVLRYGGRLMCLPPRDLKRYDIIIITAPPKANALRLFIIFGFTH
jgi:hypothetical protein